MDALFTRLIACVATAWALTWLTSGVGMAQDLGQVFVGMAQDLGQVFVQTRVGRSSPTCPATTSR